MSFWKRLLEHVFAVPEPPSPASAPPSGPPRSAPVPPPSAVPPPVPNPPPLPRTSVPTMLIDGTHRARVFDPALKHRGSAIRPGDPTFHDATVAAHWAGLRRLVTDHVLRAIAESAHGDHLILRGSRLLKAWVGEPAREPGDLDWVVDPPSVGPDDPWGAGLFDALVATAFARPAPPGVEFVRDAVATDDIWTYERAQGRRIVFPWRADGLPGGTVQVDVVFREALAEPDRRIVIPAADGGCISVRAATPAQSLAWKLVWLSTDWYPQGKDLYDAVLLAERFPLPSAVLDRSFELADAGAPPAALAAVVPQLRVDWDNFLAEYPWVGGTAKQWLGRFGKALRPSNAEADGVGEPRRSPGSDTLAREWLTSDVLAIARHIDAEHAYDHLPILADALQDAECDNEDVLTHCRGGGGHHRGCWVVDLVLGKE